MDALYQMAFFRPVAALVTFEKAKMVAIESKHGGRGPAIARLPNMRGSSGHSTGNIE